MFYDQHDCQHWHQDRIESVIGSPKVGHNQDQNFNNTANTDSGNLTLTNKRPKALRISPESPRHLIFLSSLCSLDFTIKLPEHLAVMFFLTRHNHFSLSQDIKTTQFCLTFLASFMMRGLQRSFPECLNGFTIAR